VNEPTFPSDVPLPDGNDDLQTVLAAWHTATLRLEQTHEVLRDEVRRLSDELEAKNRELARENRLADLGRMASHIAHEVRNNLVPVTLYLGMLRRRVDGSAESLDVLDKVAAGFTALDATVNDLLHFTVDRDPRRQSFSLRELVEDVCSSLAPQLGAQAIDVQLDVRHNQFVVADRNMLRRAVLNLALNAIDAMPKGGSLVITSVETATGIELEIADSGPGLPDDVRRRAFEPFYTTKRGGTGLGLAIVGRIAEVHGGAATAMNCPEGGAAFTLHVPQPTVRKAAA
jgi:signal transduction histidine kinase